MNKPPTCHLAPSRDATPNFGARLTRLMETNKVRHHDAPFIVDTTQIIYANCRSALHFMDGWFSSVVHDGHMYIAAIVFLPLRPATWTNHPIFRLFAMGNQQSATPYEPTTMVTPAAPGAKPIKSAMRRTSSVSDDAFGLAQDASTTRYLPKGLGAGHSGLVIPTKPGDVSMTAGYHSPEWGWYINTTPPTPEMYHNHYSSTRPKKSSLKDSTRRSVALQPSQTALQTSGPPPTFSNHANARTTNMGWPSVPL